MKKLYLSYKQFCIFTAGLENPFNDWTDVQMSQGFSLRNGSVSIMTISSAGILRVGVPHKDRLLEKAERIFEFRFAVENSRVEIATITKSFKVRLKNGSYKVRVQLWLERAGTDICYVSFLENSPGNLPRYIRHDSAITRLENFDLNGTPAL